MHLQLSLLEVPPTICAECHLVVEDAIQVTLAAGTDTEELVWICREHWHDFPGDFIRAR